MYLILRLQKAAFRRFMDGRPGPWGMVAVGAFGFRTLWRWSKRSEDVVYRKELEPGESVTISHRNESAGDLTRAERKAASTAGRSSRRARRAVRRAARV